VGKGCRSQDEMRGQEMMGMKISISILLVALAVTASSTISYRCGLKCGRKENERAVSRPFIELLIWNLYPSNGELTDDKKRAIMRIVLLDYLASYHTEPVREQYRNNLIKVLKECSTKNERKIIFDEIFNGVTEIQKSNGAFVSQGKVRLAVLWGSPLIEKDLDGEECIAFIANFKEEFMRIFE
jgi:hypothetical protein